MKSERGTSVECTTKIQGTKISAVVWKDNRLVTLLSTYVGEQPKNEVKRFSKAQKKSVKIACPNSVIVYNKHMGGVDLLDANIGRYKIKMRTIKWYMRLFYHLLDVTTVNSWILYKKVFEQKKLEGKPMSLSQFREDLGTSLCTTGKIITPTRGRLLKKSDISSDISDLKRVRTVNHIPDSIRFDHVSHWPEWNKTRQRCNLSNCKGFTFVYCSKCKKSLCFNKNKNCFVKYHMP